MKQCRKKKTAVIETCIEMEILKKGKFRKVVSDGALTPLTSPSLYNRSTYCICTRVC